MDYYMWVDITTTEALLIPISDEAETTKVCSHDDVDHKTCVNDPDCDERLRLLPELSADKKNPQ